MGKRKGNTPQKADAAKRQALTWNMLDDSSNIVSNTVNPVDTAASTASKTVTHQDLNAKTHFTSLAVQQKIDLCDFYLQIQNQSLDEEKYLKLGLFNLKLMNTFTSDIDSASHAERIAAFSTSSEFWFYVSSDPTCHVIYVEHDCKENITESCRNSNCGLQSTCFNVTTHAFYKNLVHLQIKAVVLCVHKFDLHSEEIVISISVPKTFLTKLKFPSEGCHKPKKVNKAMQSIMEICHAKATTDYCGRSFTRNHNIETFFKEVMSNKKSKIPSLSIVQHEKLIPLLRPYQRDAVNWMLSREKTNRKTDQTAKLHPLYEEITLFDGKSLFYNKHAGFLVEDKPQAAGSPPGGILADEMGLGKTVEVLSCILCHPRTDLHERTSQEEVANIPFTEDNTESDFVFSCKCGAKDTGSDDQIVRCVDCGVWQHPRCVQYDMNNPHKPAYKCPHCLVADTPIPSGATLIISPNTICHQWVEEIQKHIRESTLKVLVYQGVHKGGFIQPLTLAGYDVVITTYETLRKELDYVDLPHSNNEAGRKLRHPKRFVTSPSPMVAVEWWRICLDEAQMVECTTTKAAEMALRLTGINRWCVTGTPVQKDLDDLYGLLLFLGREPYWVQVWWHKLLYEPYCYGDKEPLISTISEVLWRTAKNDVLDQIGIPSQTQEMRWLTFLPIEEHFYRRQYENCAEMARKEFIKWHQDDMRLNSLDRHTMHKLLYPLVRLRQACCHPQAVRGEFMPLNKITMTMDQLASSLIKKTKTECEECHRQIVASMNGLAGLHIIKQEFKEAVELYRDVMRSVEEHKDELRTDDLQILHTLYNLNEILVAHGARIEPTLRDSQLPEQIDTLKNKYTLKVEHQVKSAVDSWDLAKESMIQTKEQLPDEEWWSELLHWVTYIYQDELLIIRIKEDLSDGTKGQNMANKFRDVRGLSYVLAAQLEQLETAHNTLVSMLNDLNKSPSTDIVNKTVMCCLRPTVQTEEKCPFCVTEKLFDTYENKLFSFNDRGIEQTSNDAEDAQYLVTTRRQGTWADSDTEKVLKALIAFARMHRADKELLDCGGAHLKIFEAQKKEFKSLRGLWIALKEQVSAMDELSMSTERLRLRYPDEPEPDPPVPNILELHQVPNQVMTLKGENTYWKNNLTVKLRQLLYLKNLAKTQQGLEDGQNPELCPVCQCKLGRKWSVLHCGHCYCLSCVKIMLERSGCTLPNRSLKCPLCRQRTPHSEVSYVCTKKPSDPSAVPENSKEFHIKGDHSTKVEAVISCLLEIKVKDPTAKCLVFSTWQDVLDVIARALVDNGIKFKSLVHHKFLNNIRAFKEDENISVLLLPVHSGANGLNLVEATHVLLVEPILNPAQELQAIGRVHRIGQTRPTVVHRFLVRSTIEERMYRMLQTTAMPINSHNSEETTMTISDLKHLFEQPDSEDDSDEENVQDNQQSLSVDGSENFQTETMCTSNTAFDIGVQFENNSNHTNEEEVSNKDNDNRMEIMPSDTSPTNMGTIQSLVISSHENLSDSSENSSKHAVQQGTVVGEPVEHSNLPDITEQLDTCAEPILTDYVGDSNINQHDITLQNITSDLHTSSNTEKYLPETLLLNDNVTQSECVETSTVAAEVDHLLTVSGTTSIISSNSDEVQPGTSHLSCDGAESILSDVLHESDIGNSSKSGSLEINNSNSIYDPDTSIIGYEEDIEQPTTGIDEEHNYFLK